MISFPSAPVTVTIASGAHLRPLFANAVYAEAIVSGETETVPRIDDG